MGNSGKLHNEIRRNLQFRIKDQDEQLKVANQVSYYDLLDIIFYIVAYFP